MEYLEGETLDDRLPWTAAGERSAPVCSQIADALDHAHRERIVHRDLKPSNVMLTSSGAKLLDFGLARAPALELAAPVSTLSSTARTLTAEGTIVGTFQYMAPEQLEGKDADARTEFCFRHVDLRDGHGAQGVRRQESGEPDRVDSDRTSTADLLDTRGQWTAPGARPRGGTLPREESRRTMAVGA